MASTTEAKKPSITFTLTVTTEGKEGLTFDDVLAQRDKGNKMKEALKTFGAVEGACVIGKQTFKL